MRLRLLPVLIFAGATLLTVRAGTMWQSASYDAGELAVAETAQPAAGDPPAAAPVAASTAAPATTPPATGAADPAAATPAPAAAGDLNPFAYSDSEIALLQSLAARRAELDQRESGIAEREALIAAAEKRVEQKLVDLKQVEASIQAALGAQQASNEQMASLVKIYETMKPKDAARIFDQLDFAVLVEVVSRMREMKSAPVLAAMDPAKAELVTVALAARAEQNAGDPAAPPLAPPLPAAAAMPAPAQ